MNKVKNLSKSSSGTGSVERAKVPSSNIQLELLNIQELQKRVLQGIISLGGKLHEVRLLTNLQEDIQAAYEEKFTGKEENTVIMSPLATSLRNSNIVWQNIIGLIDSLYIDLDLDID
jgi:hypothetical protein